MMTSLALTGFCENCSFGARAHKKFNRNTVKTTLKQNVNVVSAKSESYRRWLKRAVGLGEV
jgi:hypothetical protein